MKIGIKDATELQEKIIKGGFTYRSLGSAISLSHGHLGQIINGKKNLTPPVAKRIADSLHLNFDDIFFIDHGNKSEQVS